VGLELSDAYAAMSAHPVVLPPIICGASQRLVERITMGQHCFPCAQQHLPANFGPRFAEFQSLSPLRLRWPRARVWLVYIRRASAFEGELGTDK
jgi:hypothetical protein